MGGRPVSLGASDKRRVRLCFVLGTSCSVVVHMLLQSYWELNVGSA